MTDPHPISLRLTFPGHPRFGPGKAALLEHIRDTGSISKAGRAMEMSYKRAWSLVEEMNRMFSQPLVESCRGGVDGGGATLTHSGVVVLTAYRALEQATLEAGAVQLAVIHGLLSDMSHQK